MPEILDFLQYLRQKNDKTLSGKIEKRLTEWDAFVESIQAAVEEETGDFERARFDRETEL
ncbi:MAG: hypothetical protein LBT08_06060 [Synergistaceae bacterium]|jgi:hypothetical protein|nr:hypothetical protein [Synergistaceae bacterium]